MSSVPMAIQEWGVAARVRLDRDAEREAQRIDDIEGREAERVARYLRSSAAQVLFWQGGMRAVAEAVECRDYREPSE